MRWFGGLLAGSGIAAFFFFSWVIQMLWNSLIVGHLGVLKALSYWQAAGLWFLVIILFAWVGVGVSPRMLKRWKTFD
jgi:hypothetical protein